ncbi:MAG: hypothetical protein FWG56_01760 [Desulfovibrionaceae bacterium]|jgi:uncharacterized cupredoxin-like copper-binding protein|nr:hypothetical protein [Desulfovibrionaceae bacterium]
MSKFKSAAVLALCVVLTPAFAQSLGEKQRRADIEKSLNRKMESVTMACGPMKFQFDWSTFQDVKDMEINFCMHNGLNTVENICLRTKAGKEAVQSKIKTITCKVSVPRTFSLKNGEFVYGFDPANADGGNWSYDQKPLEKFLMDNL